MVRDELKPLAPLGGIAVSAGGIWLTEIIGWDSKAEVIGEVFLIISQS